MHRTEYGHTRIILGHVRYICYSLYVWYTVAFWYTRIGSAFSILGIIPSEFWYVHFDKLYIWYTGWYTKCVGSRSVGTPNNFLTH